MVQMECLEEVILDVETTMITQIAQFNVTEVIIQLVSFAFDFAWPSDYAVVTLTSGCNSETL